MEISERQLLIKAVAELDAMKEGDDEEGCHTQAELILQNLLRDLGFGEAGDAFDRACIRVGFWYD